MKKFIKSFITLSLIVFMISVSVLIAKTIIGPGTPDGSQGTYFWYRDNKGTAQGAAWKDRGHLSLRPGKTYTFNWIGIDDSCIYPDNVEGKEAWQVFVMDAGEGNHGWEQLAMQVRKDEDWYQPDRVIRLFANWTSIGQAVIPQGLLDLRLALTQTDAMLKTWHIEAWYDVGGAGWQKFVDTYQAIGGDGELTQACAGIQVDKDTAGPLHFHPAAP